VSNEKQIKPAPATKKALNIKHFTNWTVIDWCRKDNKYLNCICVCGTEKRVRSDSLLNGDSTSCGCLQKEMTRIRFKGRRDPNAVTRHHLYSKYKNIFARCYSESNLDYKHYGGRGITVCERWISPNKDVTGFLNFLEDMEKSYFEGGEIERLDVNGNYSPDNCTWVCRRSQVNNLRRSRLLEGYGVQLTVSEWGSFLGFDCKLLDDRINHLKKTGNLEKILKLIFRDRQHTLRYKGCICSASEIFEAEGYTEGQRNYILTKHGDSINGLRAKGVDFEVIKPREKSYMGFDEALKSLRDKKRDTFEEHLLYKIEVQLGV
jgi:hypothetical protein